MIFFEFGKDFGINLCDSEIIVLYATEIDENIFQEYNKNLKYSNHNGWTIKVKIIANLDKIYILRNIFEFIQHFFLCVINI